MLEESPLTTLDQIQSNRTVYEMEMPERRRRIHLVPDVSNARNRRLEQREFLHLTWILSGVGISDHQADVVADKVNSCIAKATQELMNIGRNGLLIVMAVRPGGVAEAPHIGRYDGVVLAEIVEQRNPHVRRVPEPMNQHERLRPGAGFQ